MRYRWTWFDPENGKWGRFMMSRADAAGTLHAPPFPAGGSSATRDVAAKMTIFLTP
jgi:hypothetical protein